MPGSYFDEELRAWVFEPSSDRAALVAIKLFPAVKKDLDPAQLERIGQLGRVGRFDAATQWADGRSPAELLPNTPDWLRDTLYPYQLTDLAFLAARMRQDGGGYLGWDRGLGKTLGAITLAYELDADRVLVVTPAPSKQLVWAPEIAKWDKDDRFTGRVYDIGNTAARRAKAVARFRTDGGVLICHYEALRLLTGGLPEADLIICDEAHRLASAGPGRTTKFFAALRKVKSKYRLALSGSVIINSPEDFFGANHWLFPSIFRSRWRDWNNSYLDYVDSGFGRVLLGVKPERLEDMQNALAAFMVIRSKEDELPGLPEKLVEYRYVDLSPLHREVYDSLAENFLATLSDGRQITTGTVIENLTMLRKVAVGLDLVDTQVPESAKFDAAAQMCEDNPGKTVVFCWHRAAADILSRRLTDRHVTNVVVHGGVSHNKRVELVNQFRDPDGPKVLIATIKTLGESVDLTCASDLIFVESSWTAADMEQATDRVFRNGQNNRVTVTHLIARNTIDDLRVLPSVTSKADLRRMILGGTSE